MQSRRIETSIGKTSFGWPRVATKLVLAIAILFVSANLYGCGPSDENDAAAMAAPCSGDQQSCEALDNARQLRDAADYGTEPELGYVKSPPGMLPMPLTTRNSPLN